MNRYLVSRVTSVGELLEERTLKFKTPHVTLRQFLILSKYEAPEDFLEGYDTYVTEDDMGGLDFEDGKGTHISVRLQNGN